MKNIKITLRQKSILQDICSSSDYITISKIAKHINVSTRTILREMDEIEKWLEYYGVSLDKKTRFGIRIDGDEEDRGFIMDMLLEEQGRNIYTPEERQKIIIIELLKNQEPVKLYNFSNLLNVADATISNDLDKIEEWLRNNELQLIRKPGIGIFVEAQEKSIRKAIIKLIYENVNEGELLSLVNGVLTEDEKVNESKEQRTNSRLLYLIDKETIYKLEKLINELEVKIGFHFTDNAYIGFIVHLALAIERIRKDEKISMDKDFLNDLKKYPEYVIAEELATDLGEIFNVNIPKDEVGYITMHIKGTKYLGNNSKGNLVGNFELVKLSRQIIKSAEAETGSILQHDERLLAGLVNHIGPAINRMKLGMDIRNPLLEEIKKHYPHLMELGKKCVIDLEKYLKKKIPESEIAYIAMHLGSVLEKDEGATQKVYRVVVACATGVGTSGLLATRLEKEYTHIEIIDVISILHIDEKMLEANGIDFIISTIAFEQKNIPVVVVNPLLFKEDIEKINNFIMNYSGVSKNNIVNRNYSISFREKVLKTQFYLDAIVKLLDNFYVRDYKKFGDISEIISEVSKVTSNSENDQKVIYEALMEREKKGATVVARKKFILIHGRVSLPIFSFGIIRIEDELKCSNNNGEEDTVNMALVMIFSDNHNKEYKEVMSHISRAVIDRDNFIKDLKSKEFEFLYDELCTILQEFIKGKNIRIEGGVR